MTFATACPSCNGSGGLKSLTLGLDAAGMLKQMEENKKTQCGTCAGKGTVWVQTMSSDTGVIGVGSKEKASAGRWGEDVKDGRKRNLHIYMADNGADVNDQSYLGYFSDLNKPIVACNFAISIGGDVVTIQTLKPGSKDVQHKNIPLAQFMDILDLLIL